MIDMICQHCGLPFKAPASKSRKYCGVDCGHLAHRGRVSKNRRHNLTGSTEHKVWLGMRRRCTNPNRPNYKYYGARGIKVCERWDDFQNFLDDMGPRPGPEYTVERKDNDRDYEPDNCYWATRDVQNRNKSNLYTPDQDAKIREMVAQGCTFPQMAAEIGKSRSSVMMRTYRLGLKSGRPPPDPTKRAEWFAARAAQP